MYSLTDVPTSYVQNLTFSEKIKLVGGYVFNRPATDSPGAPGPLGSQVAKAAVPVPVRAVLLTSYELTIHFRRPFTTPTMSSPLA